MSSEALRLWGGGERPFPGRKMLRWKDSEDSEDGIYWLCVKFFFFQSGIIEFH